MTGFTLPKSLLVPLQGVWDSLLRKDDRRRSFRSSSRILFFALVNHVWLKCQISPRVHEIWREMCNLPRRIQALRESTLCIYLGTVHQDPLYPLRNMETHACTQDMQSVAYSHRWATRLDHYLFVQGWQLGAEWVLRGMGIPDSGRVYKSLTAFWSSPAKRHSMSRLATQQETKHDLLSLLPSQVLRDELARRDKSCTTQKIESQPLEDSQTSSSTHSSDE